MIQNRLKKNLKQRKSWLNESIEAFRLYDRDIPEYPFIVEIFKNHAVCWKKTDAILDKGKEHHFSELLKAVEEELGIAPENIHIKERAKQSGSEQYTKLNRQQHFFEIREYGAKYLVNLDDYLDTGLFLDHRPLRKDIQNMKAKKSMLNLFCYTGSVSVAAALAGMRTVSVDLSKTYLEWARENFSLNKLDRGDHVFLNEDVLNWLAGTQKEYKDFDLIFLDPPTFSNSKKMNSTFEVEKDHEWMIEKCMKLLNNDGVLYFSTNKRKFKFDLNLFEIFQVKDCTKKSIPLDFHDQKIHHLFEIRHQK